MGTNTGTVMTLANSIIGVSVLAMPFCFKQCGIVLSILMLVCSSFVSRLACHFLLKAAIMARRRNFEFLAFHIFGSTGKFTAELFIIGFLMGTCIAFFVVMGDLGPAIIAKAIGISNTDALRPSVLIGLAVFVVLPLGLLRNVDSLASVCTVTIGFYGCLVLKVMAEATPHLLAGDWLDKVHLWRPAGIMQCIPIFSMALFCQTQLFEIYETLHNASLERMNDIIRTAVNMCTVVYICVGFFGYIAYCTLPFTGNVMMSFTQSSVSEVIKVGFVLSVAVSFPLVIFPCRASLYSLLFRRMAVPHHEVVSGHIPETRFKCLTVFIISVALLVGLLIPNIELVLGLVGSTIGVLICVTFPAAAFICISSKSSYERLLAQVLLFVGVLILVLGTYATLYAANETAALVEVAPVSPQPIAEKVPQLVNKPPHDVEPLEPKAEAKVKMKEDVVELQPTAGARQEPPVPVEPQDAPKVVVKEPVAPVQLDKSPEVVVKEVEKSPEAADPKITAPDQQLPEPEKKEEAKLIDQDAIRKEDEELAEAEKRAKNEADKKDAELLRKLEKHEEEQIKLLQEQKQILKALQEHKKEIERTKNLTGNNIPQENAAKVNPSMELKDIVAKDNPSILEPNVAKNNPSIEQQKDNPIILEPIVAKDNPSILQQKDNPSIVQQKENPSIVKQEDSPRIVQQNIAGEKPRIAELNLAKIQQNIGKDNPSMVQLMPAKNDSTVILQGMPKDGVHLVKQEPPLPRDTEERKANVDIPIVPEDEDNVPVHPKPVGAAKNVVSDMSGGMPNLMGQKPAAQHLDMAAKQEPVKKPIASIPVATNFLMERLKSPLAAQEAKVMRREILQREKRDTEEENCAAPGSSNRNDTGTVPKQNADIPLSPSQVQNVSAKNTEVVGVSQEQKMELSEGQHAAADEQLIKIANHLTEPKVQVLESQQAENDLQPGTLLQRAKPMKRDLKSLAERHNDDDDND